MIKMADENVGRAWVFPIPNGTRIHQLIKHRQWANRRAQYSINRHVAARAANTVRKIEQHQMWLFEKKLPQFDRNNFGRIILMTGGNRIRENCDYVIMYQPKAKPVLWWKDGEPGRSVKCRDCGWIHDREAVLRGILTKCEHCHPVPESEEGHDLCLDCDALILMHRRGYRHCTVCEEETCVHNQHPYRSSIEEQDND